MDTAAHRMGALEVFTVIQGQGTFHGSERVKWTQQHTGWVLEKCSLLFRARVHFMAVKGLNGHSSTQDGCFRSVHWYSGSGYISLYIMGTFPHKMSVLRLLCMVVISRSLSPPQYFPHKMACIKDAVHSPDFFLREYFPTRWHV